MEEYTQITIDQWQQWKEDIRRKLAETANNFVYIGYRLKQIRDSGMFGGSADIFEFAQKEYGLGKSTVSRFIAINERYSEGGNSLELKEEFKQFSSSKLAEMLTLPDNEIELITEKTTIKEIRELKSFNSQEKEDTEEEEPNWTPLEKCLIDFFKERKEILNGVMKHLEADPRELKQAAELMAPSGQASHKKGIVFLFMYDWNTGIKYKIMTQPDPVSMTWTELLGNIYRIYGFCDPEDVWKDFYKAGEETGERKKERDEEKTVRIESNQGLERSVATSQQKHEEQSETDHEEEKQENIESEENEPETNESETKTDANVTKSDENETEIDEIEALNASEKDQIFREKVENEHHEEETGEERQQQEPIMAAGEENRSEEREASERKYEAIICELIENVAFKSKTISDLLQGKERKEVSEYRKVRASINSLNTDLEQLIKFIDLEEEESGDDKTDC